MAENPAKCTLKRVVMVENLAKCIARGDFERSFSRDSCHEIFEMAESYAQCPLGHTERQPIRRAMAESPAKCMPT